MSAQITVKEAEYSNRPRSGQAFMAPGNLHMLVDRVNDGLALHLSDGPLVSRHRPSVDVLFRSVAISVCAKAVGVIMTGKGDDGAQGLLERKQAGATNVVQREASCVVFGMPREAITRGAVDLVLPLERIAAEVISRSVAIVGGLEQAAGSSAAAPSASKAT